MPRCLDRHDGSAPDLADERMIQNAARDAAEDIARRSYGKLVAYLSARMRDVAAAEDALADAFTAALADWPAKGIPQNPEAWLLSVARRKAIDTVRRWRTGEESAGHLQMIHDELEAVTANTSDIPDQRLALMFAC